MYKYGIINTVKGVEEIPENMMKVEVLNMYSKNRVSMKGYKRTNYVTIVLCERYTPTYRTVYEKDGEYYYFFRSDVSKVSKDALIPKDRVVK